MKRTFNWFCMLNKRLYKKLSFIIILVLIPLAVLTMTIIANEESGFVHIVLAQHDPNDKLATQITDELLNDDSLVRFTKVKNEKQAMEMVRNGVADEAWIFHSNTKDNLSEFATPKSDYSPAVTVICKNKTVLMAIANEKLSSTMYEKYAKTYYLNCIRHNIEELDSLSQSELSEYFDNYSVNEKLFEFRTMDGKPLSDSKSNYLTSPIRGLLGILIVLSSMAATMFYMQDNKKGTFSWIPERKRIYVAFFCILIATLNVSAVSLISLLCAGLTKAILKEVAVLILYSLCVSAFCLLLMQIFRSIKLYSAMLPLLCVLMVAVCPVFFDLRSIFMLQHLLPPTYFVNVSTDNIYLLYIGIYTIVMMLLCFVIETIKNKKDYLKLFRHK